MNSRKLRVFLSELFRVNWSKTLYINFRMFPLKDALKLPVLIWGRCRLSLKGGRIVVKVPVKAGILKIGYRYENFNYKEPAQIKIHGTFTLNGRVWLGSSLHVFIDTGASLIMGEMSSIGSSSSLICTKSIILSDYARIGSLSDISDSNYHYMKNLLDNSVIPFQKPIKIGARNYIGSRVAILPGTITPDNIAIGFGSVCNKDYRGIIPENSIIAGIPAKLVKKNITRIFDLDKEAEITCFFAEPGNTVYYDTDN